MQLRKKCQEMYRSDIFFKFADNASSQKKCTFRGMLYVTDFGTDDRPVKARELGILPFNVVYSLAALKIAPLYSFNASLNP